MSGGGRSIPNQLEPNGMILLKNRKQQNLKLQWIKLRHTIAEVNQKSHQWGKFPL